MFQVRNRYYHPNLGRWISRDPIGYEDGINLYAYVGNKPTNSFDPFGYKGVWDLVKEYWDALLGAILNHLFDAAANKPTRAECKAACGNAMAAGVLLLAATTTAVVAFCVTQVVTIIGGIFCGATVIVLFQDGVKSLDQSYRSCLASCELIPELADCPPEDEVPGDMA
jgi:hypothetical protein